MDGESFQGLHRRDALSGADDDSPLAGDAVDGGPHDEELVNRRDVIVGVIGKADATIEGGFRGADEGALFGAAVRDVRGSEEVGVLRVEGRNDLPRSNLIELVAAHELAVNDAGAVVARLLVAEHGLVGREKQVNRRIAVAVDDEVESGVIHLLDLALQDWHREARLALPVFFPRGTAREIGRGEPGGLALWRTIQRELDAAELQAMVVFAEGSRRVVLQDFLEERDEWIGDDIDEQITLGGPALKDLDVGCGGGSFLGGGDAGGGIDQLCFFQRGHRLVRAGLRQV